MAAILDYLQGYQGRPLRLMEVCGTHTAQIRRNGIPALLPPSIHLVSGPGCPVCVTVSAYIDRLIQLGLEENHVIATFGDMLRVPGSRQSLSQARAEGCRVKMVYSPLDVLKLAEKDPAHIYIFAAVGFETTAPVYAMLLRKAMEKGIGNLRLLTSLKVMPPVIDRICQEYREANGTYGIDGFLAPGHVSVVTGSRIFADLARRHGIPFVVAGFEGEQILGAIAALVRLCGQTDRGQMRNMYPSAVTPEGNLLAQEAVNQYFEPCDAAWRGLGVIPSSGLRLRREYAAFDAGGAALLEDMGGNPACHCAQVLTGRLQPRQCPLFGQVCTPDTPQGACMVSTEGSCFSQFQTLGRSDGGNECSNTLWGR